MRWLVAVALFVVSMPASARPAGNFGFGQPPAYLELMRAIRARTGISDTESLEISRPTAACLDRGHPGRRDVCGYRFCMRVRGEVGEVWRIQGFGIEYNPSGRCGQLVPWVGDPPVDVAEFCDFQPKHPDCKSGRKEGLVKLSVEESTGAAELARRKAEVDRIEAEKQAELRAKAEAERAAEEARIAEIKSVGPTRAYPALAIHRYRTCQRVADAFLQADVKDARELFEIGLDSIEKCAAEEERELALEVREALGGAPARAVVAIKDLHAYTVASLRALTNFHQSVIEARQARAERMAGIDERATRLELEL